MPFAIVPPKQWTVLVGLAEDVLSLVAEAVDFILVVLEPGAVGVVMVVVEERLVAIVPGVVVKLVDAGDVVLILDAGIAVHAGRRQASFAIGFEAPDT